MDIWIPSIFFAACGTFMIWKRVARSKSHFYGGTFYTHRHFYERTFGVWLHFYGRTFLIPKIQNTKFTRKIDEENTKDTRNFACFSSNEGEKHRAKIACWFVENQWSNLDHWKAKGQNDPMKSKAQSEPLVWLTINHTTSCQDGARLQTLSQVATRWHSKMPPRNFFEKPIDKIRPLCYTFIKEVQVLLW